MLLVVVTAVERHMVHSLQVRCLPQSWRSYRENKRRLNWKPKPKHRRKWKVCHTNSYWLTSSTLHIPVNIVQFIVSHTHTHTHSAACEENKPQKQQQQQQTDEEKKQEEEKFNPKQLLEVSEENSKGMHTETNIKLITADTRLRNHWRKPWSFSSLYKHSLRIVSYPIC